MAPLRFATMLGLLLALTAFIYGAEILYETLSTAKTCPAIRRSSSALMVLGGVQLIMLGVVGEYIGKILYEIKGRPVYFVAEHAVKLREERAAPRATPAPRLNSAPPPRGDGTGSYITTTLVPTFTRS